MQNLHELIAHYVTRMVDEPVIIAFTWAVIIDIITGFAKSLMAKVTPKMTISKKGLQGLITHACVIIIVLTLFPLASAMGFYDQITFLIGFYVIIYVVSIVENLGEMGVPIPKFVKSHLAKLQDDYEHEGEKKGSENDKKE